MRKFDSKIKNKLYFIYRVIEPIFDPIKTLMGLYGYSWIIRDYYKYNKKAEDKLSIFNLFPQVHDKTSFTPFDAHYFYQQLWVFENVHTKNPEFHIDIGSTYEMSGYLSKIVPTKFIDYRPIDTSLDNLEIIRGDILNLPLEDSSVRSLSCLHVVEHIGLGRYGDEIDPDGFEKAVSELCRVLAPGGDLYFSTPVGKEKVYFNAHRVTDPVKIVDLFSDLELKSFDIVDDDNIYHNDDAQPKDFVNQNYGCGMYHFTKGGST